MFILLSGLVINLKTFYLNSFLSVISIEICIKIRCLLITILIKIKILSIVRFNTERNFFKIEIENLKLFDIPMAITFDGPWNCLTFQL